jgi:hypothetical protein
MITEESMRMADLKHESGVCGTFYTVPVNELSNVDLF